MNYNHIIHTYGPLSEIDFIKVNLLNHLKDLNASISEEKYLHQHICINVLPTPYKTELMDSKRNIEYYWQKICNSSTIDEVVGLSYDFEALKKEIHTNMKVAYDKTVFLISQVRNMAALNDLKGRLQREVSQRVQNAIQAKDTVHNDTDKRDTDNPAIVKNDISPQARGVFIKKNIADIMATTRTASLKPKERTIDEDLLYCANRLLAGEYEKLKEHFYFAQHPDFLHQYPQTEHHLNEKTTKIFLVLQAKKIVMNNPKATPTEIFDIFFKFFNTLMNYDKYRDMIGNGVNNLRNYVSNLRRVRENNSDPTGNNIDNIPEDKREIYSKLQTYVSNPSDNP